MENEITSALTEHAKAIRKLGKQTIESVISIGRHLTEAKSLAGYEWPVWLKREFGWNERTARRFMDVHAMSIKGNLPFADVPISSLYLLAAPSTSDEIRHKIMAKAAKEPMKHAEVVKAIRESGPAPKKGRPPKAPGVTITKIIEALKSAPDGLTVNGLRAALPDVPMGSISGCLSRPNERGPFVVVETGEKRGGGNIYRYEANPIPSYARPISVHKQKQKVAPESLINNFGVMTEYKPRTWEELGGPAAHLRGVVDPNDPQGRTYLEVHIAKYGRVQLKHTSEVEARWRKEAYAKAATGFHHALIALEKQMPLWDAVETSDNALATAVTHPAFLKDLAKLEAMVERLAGIREALSVESGPRLVSSNG